MKMEDYNEYYIQGSDHYLIPKDVFMEIFNEMINWKEESQKQKEAIDKINLIIKGVAYDGSEDYYMEKFSKINELIKEVSE